MPILFDIFRHAWLLGGQFSDAGLMAKAIGYIRNQHRALRRFLEDGRISLDNNVCERSIRPIAIGRRNWLFAGSMRGGRAAAVVFSLAESCCIANVDPVDYFADVLVRVGTHPASRVDELLPENWARLFARKPGLKLRGRSSQLAPAVAPREDSKALSDAYVHSTYRPAASP